MAVVAACVWRAVFLRGCKAVFDVASYCHKLPTIGHAGAAATAVADDNKYCSRVKPENSRVADKCVNNKNPFSVSDDVTTSRHVMSRQCEKNLKQYSKQLRSEVISADWH